MPDHTPGPWEWYTSNSYHRLGTKAGYQELMWAVVYRDGHPGIEFRNRADADLIAAAPEMADRIEALEAEVERLREDPRLALTRHNLEVIEAALVERYAPFTGLVTSRVRAALAALTEEGDGDDRT